MRLNLYWMETADHQSDWFVFGMTTRIARAFYANEEGRAYKETTARKVGELIGDDYEVGWPSNERLAEAGVEITERGHGCRLVTINGKTLVDTFPTN